MSAQTGSRHAKLKDFGACWHALVILLALATLVGCQGVSAAGPANQQQQPQNAVLSLSGSALNFGTVAMGGSKTLTITAQNSGTATLTITSAQSTAPQFSVSKPAFPLTIAAGANATLSVTFTPSAADSASGTISISSNAANGPVGLEVDGDGSAPGVLAVSPDSLAFGSLLLGNSQKQPGTLTNTGGSDVTVSQANVTGAGFSLGGVTLPVTLAAGQSTSFSVVFSPQSAGTVDGTVTFVSNASDSPLSLPLSGTGLAPGSLSANPSSLNFGGVVVGNNQALSETLTNSSGSSVTITQAIVSGSGFSITGLDLPVTLTAGQSTGFNVVFAPESPGSASSSLSITSNAANPTLTVPLAGLGLAPGTLSPNPSSLGFGSVEVGHQQTLSETLTNTGGSDATISQYTVTGDGFSVNGLNLPLTLPSGQGTTFNVVFAPQSTGSVSGNLTITSNASNPSLIIPLSGSGTPSGQLSVNPSSLNFNSVAVGSYLSLPASLKATGTSVTVTSGVSGNSAFTLSGISFPVTIQAGDSQGFTVTFTPQGTGQVNATLTFASNASNSPTVQSLSGNGTPAVHSVLLQWNASSSSDVVGYNVYRGTQSGGPYSQINSSLDSTTTYTDTNVTDGDTYYYVTTAVDSYNQESVYSNEAQAHIPSD